MSTLLKSKDIFYRFVSVYIINLGILYVLIAKGSTEILYSLISLTISFVALSFIIDIDSFFYRDNDSFSQKRSEFLVMGEEQVGDDQRVSSEQRYLNYVEKSFSWVKKVASASVFIAPFFFSDIGLGFRSLITLTSLCIINTSYINQFKIPVLLYLVYFSLTQKVDSVLILVIIISLVFFLMIYFKSYHSDKVNLFKDCIYLSSIEVIKYFFVFLTIMLVINKFDLSRNSKSKLMKRAIESARFDNLPKKATKLDHLVKDEQDKIKELERTIRNQRTKKASTLSEKELDKMLSRVEALSNEVNSLDDIDLNQLSDKVNSSESEVLNNELQGSESQQNEYNDYIKDIENYNLKVEKLNSLQNKIDKASKDIAKQLNNSDINRKNSIKRSDTYKNNQIKGSNTSKNILQSYHEKDQEGLVKRDLLNSSSNEHPRDRHEQLKRAQKIDPQNELKAEIKKHKNKLGSLSKFIELILDWIHIPIAIFAFLVVIRFFKSKKISKTIDHDKVLSPEIKYKLKHIFDGQFDNYSIAVEISFRRFCHCLDEIYFSGKKTPPPGILVTKLFVSNKRINNRLRDSVEVFNSYMYMNSEITNKNWKKYRKSLQIVINYIIKSGNLI